MVLLKRIYNPEILKVYLLYTEFSSFHQTISNTRDCVYSVYVKFNLTKSHENYYQLKCESKIKTKTSENIYS